jgi:hypothetical protein
MSLSVAEEPKPDEIPSTLLSGSPGLPIEPVAGALSQDQSQIVEKLRAQLDATVFRLLMSASSSADFRQLRKDLYARYTNLSGAVSNIVRAELRKTDLEAMAEDAYADIAEIIRGETVLFGGDENAREEVLFCTETLHRAQMLLCQVITVPAPGDRAAEDAKLLQDAVARTWWSFMHLHCILFAIRRELRPAAEVQHEILVGLRASVMAYAAIRQSWAFRFESVGSVSLPPDPILQAPELEFNPAEPNLTGAM